MADIYMERMLKKIQKDTSGNIAVDNDGKKDIQKIDVSVKSVPDYDELSTDEKLVRTLIGDLFLKNFSIVDETIVLSDLDDFKHELNKYFSGLAKTNSKYIDFVNNFVR